MNNKEMYDSRYSDGIPYKYKTNTRYQRYLIERIEKVIDSAKIKSVCDIGCGQGLNTTYFCADYPNAVIKGIDISEAGIRYAKKKYESDSNIVFVQGDVRDYFEETKETFDLVCAFELLEHIKDWRAVAGKMAEISNAYIMVSSPVGRMRKYEVRHGHYRNFKRGELENFFERSGFRTLKTYYAGFPFWSPITRDLLNLMPGDSIEAQKQIRGVMKVVSLLLYYSYRYLSSVHMGDQFIGVWGKK